jgi:hypothetical protein
MPSLLFGCRLLTMVCAMPYSPRSLGDPLPSGMPRWAFVPTCGVNLPVQPEVVAYSAGFPPDVK